MEVSVPVFYSDILGLNPAVVKFEKAKIKQKEAEDVPISLQLPDVATVCRYKDTNKTE